VLLVLVVLDTGLLAVVAVVLDMLVVREQVQLDLVVVQVVLMLGEEKVDMELQNQQKQPTELQILAVAVVE
jgi:hypothetical protein